MKGIIYKTAGGIAIIGANPVVLGQIKTIFMQENPKNTAEDAEQAAYIVIAEKDIPRILPADKQVLWAKGLMQLKKYLTYPLPEYKIVDASELPVDRIFRNAWGYDLKEDIAKSRELKKDMLRRDRTPLLADLDVEFTRAQEIGADTTDIIARKQVLRDVTDLCDSAKTINDLKKIACPV